ncbi:MAG: benzoyl-CoA reductase subunit B [Parvularculaceae bacterium]
MIIQKQMIASHFEKLSQAQETGKKVVYTFVPGNLNELIRAFDMLPVHPEVNALQSGMRKLSGGYIQEAEKTGHSEDVCTYVKCDLGMMKKGNIGPTGLPLPKPDLLLLSYTGCFTFLKWFELLKTEYDCPIVMLQVPYQAGGEITDEMRDYVTRQLEEVVVPALEKVSGKKLDPDRLKKMLASSARAEELLVDIWNSAKHKPSPIDAYFGGVFYIGPIFTAFRGLPECEDYYQRLKDEVDYRIANKLGPVTPDGEMSDQKYRVVIEGPPNWTSFREFWKIFADEGVVMVASTYTKVGGLYESGFRHDPDRPLESLGEYCLGCYTNHSLPARVEILQRYIEDFDADGFLINSIKSCNSFSAGQLLMMREVEKRTGKAGGFIESDLVDPRYFSAANIKNRLESYFQMIDARRVGV